MLHLRNTHPLGAKSFSPSLFGKPTKRSYRAAVKHIILDVQARAGMSDEELAEVIGSCKETVANWRDEASSMDVLSLLTLAYCFGEDAIDPVRQLYLCAPPSDETTSDKRKRLIREMAALEDGE